MADSRNPKRAKTVLTETACPVKIEVPRDRHGITKAPPGSSIKADYVPTKTTLAGAHQAARQPPCKLVIAEQEGWTSAKCHVSL